ncbi:MAG: DUF2061 domain-containing protein [Flavobacteriales bacterium]|nr:DUF2061 domain-containing protein [Flavobacteriales bacterium]
MLIDQFIKSRTNSPRNGGQSAAFSLAKTVSWRIVGTLDTLVITFLVTGQISTALTISGVELISKMILYFLHERTWNKLHVSWNERAVRKYQERS